jgi:hypothetical protein
MIPNDVYGSVYLWSGRTTALSSQWAGPNIATSPIKTGLFVFRKQSDL